MAQGMRNQSPTNIQNYFKHADYPAQKEDLISLAQSNNAPKEVIDQLNSLPNSQFSNSQELFKAFGNVENSQTQGQQSS